MVPKGLRVRLRERGKVGTPSLAASATVVRDATP